ncbi:M20 family metallopeptidase [Nocardioides marmoraquaticus]
MTTPDPSATSTLATAAEAAAEAVVDDVRALVAVESGSYDLPGLREARDHLVDLLTVRLDAPAPTVHPGGDQGDTLTVTLPGSAAGHVALVGHYDTVWPRGTLADWDAAASEPGPDGRARLSGPGVFDMKAGLVQGVWALRLLRESGFALPTVTFCLNGDEEIGSLSSRPVIEQVGGTADATLVLEPSADGAVKTGRKGIGIFEVVCHGVESHAGLDPEAGASAIHALAEVVTHAVATADPAAGTTVNAGLVRGGSGTNVVAGHARADFDVRVVTQAERDRIDAAFDALAPRDDRVRVDVRHGWNRPPMVLTDTSAALLDVARSVSAELGRELHDVSVGGASDANFVAGLGRPVLCGLGAVGHGAHARGEFAYLDAVAPQTALVAGMLHRLAG